MKLFSSLATTAIALGVAAVLPAQGQLTGEIRIAGSSTVGPITDRIAESFQKKHTGVNIPVDITGTGGGFKRFTVGETDISNASRPIKAKEAKAAYDNGVKFIELPVAYDGLTIVVNKGNDFVDQLTVDELKSIFLAGSKAQTWKDVNSKWPATPVSIYMPGTDSGTFDYFKEVVAGDEGSIREDVTVSEDDNVLVRGVVGDKGAIGFFGCAYFFANEDKLRAVPIVNPKTDKAVAPTASTIESGEYAPFSRPLFIYVNADALDRPEVDAFIEYYLDAAPSTSEEVGYVRLPRAFYRACAERVSERTTGSAFYDDQMNDNEGTLMELYGLKK